MSSETDAAEHVDELEMLRTELEVCRQEAAANYTKYLRSSADIENYKKRLQRNYADLARAFKKGLLQKLLTVKDNLERALEYAEASKGSGTGLLEGVRLTQSQLDQLLLQEGVRPIDAEGKPFDPRLEEAVGSVDNPSVPDQTVVEVVRKGYTLGDDPVEVLRPAQVIVNVHDGKH